MTAADYRASMKDKIDLRCEQIIAHAQRVKREIDGGRIAGEEGRIWLEQFCLGHGLQLCGGDFVIGDSIAVDTELRALAMDLWAYADRFHGDAVAPLDYVVTNCLELFPDTLRMLTEYGRMLKPEGVFAVVARDAQAYEEAAGPLENPRRVSCFTITTLRCYFSRAGFEVFAWENYGKELRVAARRKA